MNHYFATHRAVCPTCQTVHEMSGKALVQVCQHCHTIFDRQKGRIYYSLYPQFASYCQTLAIGDTFLHRDILYTITGKVVKYEKGDRNAIWTEYYLTHPTEQPIFLNQYCGHWNIVEPLDPLYKFKPTENLLYFQGASYQLAHQYFPIIAYAEGSFEFNTFEEANIHSFEYINDDIDLIIRDCDTALKTNHYYRATYIFGNDLLSKLTNKVELPTKTVDYGINQPFYFNLNLTALYQLLGLATGLCAVFLFLFRFVIAPEVALTQDIVIETSDSAKAKLYPTAIKVPYDNGILNTQLMVNSLNNDWVGAEISLINDQTGEERFFSIETEYYSGSDSEGSWSEGSLVADGNISSVAKGSYHIEVLPFQQAGGGSKTITLRFTNFKGSFGFYIVFMLMPLITFVSLLFVDLSFQQERKVYYDLSK